MRALLPTQVTRPPVLFAASRFESTVRFLLPGQLHREVLDRFLYQSLDALFEVVRGDKICYEADVINPNPSLLSFADQNSVHAVF